MANRTKHLDEPGTPKWHERRERSYNAGDASAILGCHPSGVTRTEVMVQLKLGLRREFSDYQQERVLDPGHLVEAALRPVAEEIMGEDLEVAAFSLDIGLSRPLGASLDAIDFLETMSWECKSSNEALRTALPHTGRDSHARNDARKLPKGYRVQMEQGQLCSGTTRTLFTVGRLNADGSIAEERHAWYTSDPDLRAEIIGAWKQADQDLPTFEPQAAAVVVSAKPVESLPTIAATVTGALTVTSNVGLFAERARAFITTIPKQPTSDQEFADCDAAAKELRKAEDLIKAAKSSALGQVSSIEELTRSLDDVFAIVNRAAIDTENLVKRRKNELRVEQVKRGQAAVTAHIAGLNARLRGDYVPPLQGSWMDFAGAISGMKKLDNMKDAVDTLAAAAKAEASRIADLVEVNLKAIEDAGNPLLFADLAQLVLKSQEDCHAQVQLRLAAHKEAEEKKRLEQERAKQLQQPGDGLPVGAPRLYADEPVGRVWGAGSGAAAPAADAPRTLNLTAICARLGITLTAAFVRETLKVSGLQEGNATRFSEQEFNLICARLMQHVQKVAIQHEEKRRQLAAA